MKIIYMLLLLFLCGWSCSSEISDNSDNTITLDANGGQFQDGSTIKHISSAELYEQELPKKENFVFSHWNTEKDGNGYRVDSLYGDSTGDSNNITGFAQWVPFNFNPFELHVPVEYVTDALLAITGPTTLTCYNNFCGLATYEGDFAQNLINKGMASDNFTRPDYYNHITSPTKAYAVIISGEHATDALFLGGAEVAMTCSGTSPKFVYCQLSTINESTAKNLVTQGIAKSYIEDMLIPVPNVEVSPDQ